MSAHTQSASQDDSCAHTCCIVLQETLRRAGAGLKAPGFKMPQQVHVTRPHWTGRCSLSGTFIVCCFRAYCLPAVCELPPPVRVGCCSGPEAGATACENISTGSSEEQCSRARDMHTEQSDSKYRHILQQQAPPPAVSCASKPAQAKAHPHTGVGQKSAHTQSNKHKAAILGNAGHSLTCVLLHYREAKAGLPYIGTG